MKFTPHDYQKYIIDFILKHPKAFTILEMGMGKSVCTLTAIEELMNDRFEIDRVLVIAPLRVAESTWTDETEKWDHLRWRLKVVKAIGTEKQRIEALNSRADVYTINRENVKWLVDYYAKKRTWPFDMIVIDESSSFKNNTSQRFKALRKVTKLAKRVVLLTGTPDPNSLMELWPQVFLLDGGERLGRTLTEYRNNYFTPGRRNGNIVYEYVPRKGAREAIYKQIEDITVSLTAKDHLKMPERIDNVIKLKLPPKARAIYTQMEIESVLELEKGVVIAGSKAVAQNKLLQITNGAVYSIGENGEKKVDEIHDEKLEALESIIEDNAGQPTLVYYNYQHDFDRITERLKKYNPQTLRNGDDIARWNRGEIKLLVTHPASMGHGLNLQAGGSNIVWFGVPWSLELFQQANARLYRQGQQKTVVINYLLMDDTADEDVYKSLQSKRFNQDDFISAMKARIDRVRKNMVSI